jgi:hypothetical protein
LGSRESVGKARVDPIFFVDASAGILAAFRSSAVMCADCTLKSDDLLRIEQLERVAVGIV